MGAGIAGVTTARAMAEAGRRVTIKEDARIKGVGCLWLMDFDKKDAVIKGLGLESRVSMAYGF